MTDKTTAPKQHKTNTLQKLYTWILIVGTALLPLILVPFTLDFVQDSKLYLIIILSILSLIFFFLQSFKDKSWKIIVSPVTLPLTIFGVGTLASIFFTQNYPVKNLLSIGSVYLALWLIVTLASSLINEKQKDKFLSGIAISGSIVGATALLQLFDFGPAQLIAWATGAEIAHGFAVNLVGNSLIAVQFLLIALIGQAVQIWQKKKITNFHVITLPLMVLGLGIYIWTLLPGKPTQLNLPPVSASWSIALDSLRVPKSALIGQGPGGYAATFTRYKPTWMNGRENWSAIYNYAVGMPLTLLVQLGFLGTIGWILLLVKMLNHFRQEKKDYQTDPLSWMLFISLILQLLVPPNLTLLALQALIMAFWIAAHQDKFSVLKLKPLSVELDKQKIITNDSQANNTVSVIINGVCIAGLILLTYCTGKAYASQYLMFEAQKAALDNKGVELYNKQTQAKQLNPYNDGIRRAYAITNLRIAEALSNKADITDQEKQQVSQLLQQAVNEARAAIAIDPSVATNHSNLAGIYENLIGSVEEADQWAVNSYTQAIQLAPSDPLLRLQLGLILMQNEQTGQAANLFSQAVNLKPDLPSAYYYLGLAQQQAQQLTAAKQSWEQALMLLDPESEDYQELQKLLEQLETQLEEKEEQKNSAAAQPQPTEEEVENLEKSTPLSQELPSLTDQNLENPEESLNNKETPIELEENPEVENPAEESAQEDIAEQTEQKESAEETETTTDQAEETENP